MSLGQQHLEAVYIHHAQLADGAMIRPDRGWSCWGYAKRDMETSPEQPCVVIKWSVTG